MSAYFLIFISFAEVKSYQNYHVDKNNQNIKNKELPKIIRKFLGSSKGTSPNFASTLSWFRRLNFYSQRNHDHLGGGAGGGLEVN